MLILELAERLGGSGVDFADRMGGALVDRADQLGASDIGLAGRLGQSNINLSRSSGWSRDTIPNQLEDILYSDADKLGAEFEADRFKTLSELDPVKAMYLLLKQTYKTSYGLLDTEIRYLMQWVRISVSTKQLLMMSVDYLATLLICVLVILLLSLHLVCRTHNFQPHCSRRHLHQSVHLSETHHHILQLVNYPLQLLHSHLLLHLTKE